MTSSQQELLKCIRGTLFTNELYTLSDEIIEEAKQQVVFSFLTTRVDRYAVVAQNVQLVHEQNNVAKLLENVPFVVLKGTATSVYYPEPILRVLGDIDIIVRPEDFDKAYSLLKTGGYDPYEYPGGNNREVPFYKDNCVIELHRTYAELNKKEQEVRLDQWIYDAIPYAVYGEIQGHSFPMLPEPLNGLTLLAHISQHLEGGLGIRQILDWLMYVNKELHDWAWPAFREKTDQLGLTKLAKITARLGQLYLGLPQKEITWCLDADEQLCSELLEYLFECGNFGRKLGPNNTVTAVFSKGSGIKDFFVNLQEAGENTWEALRCHPSLKPVAWGYQGIRLIARGMKQVTLKELIRDIRASKRRNKLMEKLGATQQGKRNKEYFR